MADPFHDEKDRKLAEAIRALTDASREQSKRLADAANQMVQHAATGAAVAGPKARPKTTAGKLWAAVKPTATRAFNRTAAGRLAKSVSWYGKKGSRLGGRIGRALGGKEGAATGAALGGVAGKMVPIAGATLAVGGALNGLRKHVQEAAEAALESKRKFTEVSGRMAAVFGEADVKQLTRDIRRGNDTAASTKQLSDAVNDRKDQFAPLETAIDNATNRLLATGQDVLNSLLKGPIEVLTAMVETFDEFVADFRETFSIGKKDAGPGVGTLSHIQDKIEADAREAQARGRAALERMRDAARALDRGRPPRDF
ncbi:unnamed protein product [Gemmataceae bacterium]|nr:unnamed protein product [Gemmataceae bacterium]VTT97598.1 unnamed protein product [Gemmataceae bacterium]